MSGMPCQNRSFEISDVAIFVKSSKAMCRDRIPASRAAYLEDAVARGARVAVMATECDDPLHVHVPLDVGGRGCFWQSRGHCSLVARAYLAAAQNYSDGRAFTLIIDDDAVVNLTNYARAMRCMPLGEPFILGEREAGLRSWEPYPFAGGGAGVTFPTAHIPRMRQAVRELDITKADDVLISGAAVAAGMPLVAHPLIYTDGGVGGSDGVLSGASEGWVAFHKVTPEEAMAYAGT